MNLDLSIYHKDWNAMFVSVSFLESGTWEGIGVDWSDEYEGVRKTFDMISESVPDKSWSGRNGCGRERIFGDEAVLNQ